jgi:hypothetical protein
MLSRITGALTLPPSLPCRPSLRRHLRGLRQPLRRAFAFAYQRFKPSAFLAAQPNNILLYRNLLGSHDRLRRPRCDGIESQNPSPFKLIEATD